MATVVLQLVDEGWLRLDDVAVTPDFTNNPDAPVNALVDKAICS
ncbi:hypothetical protein [Kribbella sp. NBC_00359]